MRSRLYGFSSNLVLYGFKAFERWLALISPEVEAKWGAPISLACIAFDRDGALTTTYGDN